MNINKLTLCFLFPTVLLATQGCSSRIDPIQEQKIRSFAQPEQNNSGIYVYRDFGLLGAVRDIDLIFDNQKIAELENDSFVYIPTTAGSHVLVSSQRDLANMMLTGEDSVGYIFRLKTEPNKNYFLELDYLSGTLILKEPAEAISEINDSDLLPLEENPVLIGKTPLFSVKTKLYDNNLQYLNNNNVSISISDDRPFADTVSSADDVSNYIIDRNQDDTKENREKTVGYMLTTFSGLANVVVPNKITDIISNYTQHAIEENSLQNKDIKIKINELWISPGGVASNAVISVISGRQTNIVKSVGYRYSVTFVSDDKELENKREFVCSNAYYRDNVLSVDKAEIISFNESIMSEIDNCIKENLK